MNNDFQEMPSIDECYVKLSDLKLPIKRNPYDPNRDITGYIRYLKYNTNIADVRENVHAHWIYASHNRFFKSQIYKCSKCGQFLDFCGVNGGRGDANFCPNCGSQMGERRGRDV